MNGLTRRQRQMLAFVGIYARTHGYPPSIREIGRRMGITSTNGVAEHLDCIAAKGYIARAFGRSRGIEITAKGWTELGWAVVLLSNDDHAGNIKRIADTGIDLLALARALNAHLNRLMDAEDAEGGTA